MVLKKYKLYAILKFIIFERFLQIIYIDRSILDTCIFQSSKPLYLLNQLP